MKQIAILGAGGMGTALAMLFSTSSHGVSLWARDPARADDLERTRENRRHLPGVSIPDEVSITHDVSEAIEKADLIVAAIPSSFLRSTLSAVAERIPRDVPVLSVVKL